MLEEGGFYILDWLVPLSGQESLDTATQGEGQVTMETGVMQPPAKDY